MIHTGRFLLRLSGLLVLSLLDKVWGVPILTLMLTTRLGATLKPSWRYSLFLIMGLVVASLFFWSPAVGVGLVWLAYLGFRYGQRLIASHHLRMILVGLFSLLVPVILVPSAPNWRQVFYTGLILVSTLVWFKRRQWPQL